MNKHLRNIYLLFSFLIILIIVGFIILLQKFSVLEKSVSLNEENKSVSLEDGNLNLGTSESGKGEVLDETSNENKGNDNVDFSQTKTINSNILFRAEGFNISNGEKVNLPILINKVTKDPLGRLNVSLKVFTDQVNATTSLEIGDFVEVFNMTGNNIKVESVKGAFKRIPPQSSIDGILTFIINPDLDSVILQVGNGDDINFYEFNFKDGTYKLTTVG